MCHIDSNEFPRVDVIFDGFQPFSDVQITHDILLCVNSEELNWTYWWGNDHMYTVHLKLHADNPVDQRGTHSAKLVPIHSINLRCVERLTGRRIFGCL